MFLSVRDGDKVGLVPMARRLTEMGFDVLATRGTAARIRDAGLPVRVVNKVLEGRPHCVDAIQSGEVQLVINTASGSQSVADSFDIRRSALLRRRAALHDHRRRHGPRCTRLPPSRPGRLKWRRFSRIFIDRSERARRPGASRRRGSASLPENPRGPPSLQKFPMTAPGLQRLEEELRHLKSVERPSIIRAIAEARSHGDLSENAEYHAARERQSFIEGRVIELEEIVSAAEVIDPSTLSGDHIKFGAHITLVDEETEKEASYQIVGVHEADIKAQRLSISSPLAKALIGKKIGDTISVPAPGGDRTYEVLERPLRPPIGRRAAHDRPRGRPGRRRTHRRPGAAHAARCPSARGQPGDRRRRSRSSSRTCRRSAPSRSAARPTSSPC